MTQVSAPTTPSVSGCPVDHTQYFHRKSGRTGVTQTQPALEQDSKGVWHIRNFELARAVLRSSDTEQSGFNAQTVRESTLIFNAPILYLEGEQHHQLRRETARFFTPKTTDELYRPIMERTSQKLITRLIRKRRAQLDALSMILATEVASEVVGLTNSILPGMGRRLDAFFDEKNMLIDKRNLRSFPQALKSLVNVFAFFWLDVKPAIRKRRKQPQADVISHLLSKNYSDAEIITECIMYASAGMATTREFICVAAWHLLEQPALREQYLSASQADRYTLLHEILRLEPVVSTLMRTVTADLELQLPDGSPVTLPAGSQLLIHLDAANVDQKVVGDVPLMLCPQRQLHGERVNQPLLSFGDGHHRCAGAYIAIQESDIFLYKLLSLPNLRIAQKPTVHWSELTQGYEIRNFLLELA